MRPSPQQGSAVAHKARSGGDHPNKDGASPGANRKGTPQPPGRDELHRLGGSRNIESVPSQEFDKRILPVTLRESGQPLLKLREGALSSSNRASTSQSSQRQRQPG